MLKSLRYGSKSNVWQIGLIMFCVQHGILLPDWKAMHTYNSKMSNNLKSGGKTLGYAEDLQEDKDHPDLKGKYKYSTSLRVLIRECLLINWANRPTPENLVSRTRRGLENSRMAAATILKKPEPEIATPYPDPAISARWFSGQSQAPAFDHTTHGSQIERRPSELLALRQAAEANAQGQAAERAQKVAEFQTLQAQAQAGPNRLAAKPNAPGHPAAPMEVAQAPKPGMQGRNPAVPPFNPANALYIFPEDRDPPLVPPFNPANVPYIPLEERELHLFLQKPAPKPNSKLQAGLASAVHTPMVSNLPVAQTISQRIQALNAGVQGLNVGAQAANNTPQAQKAAGAPALKYNGATIPELVCIVEERNILGQIRRRNIRLKNLDPRFNFVRLKDLLTNSGCTIPKNRMRIINGRTEYYAQQLLGELVGKTYVRVQDNAY